MHLGRQLQLALGQPEGGAHRQTRIGGGDRVLAAVSEQAQVAHDAGGSTRALRHFVEECAKLGQPAMRVRRHQRGERRHLLHRHVGVGQDVGERIVDLVGDAGGQGAEASELLGLTHRALEGHALGDVLDEQDGAGGPAVLAQEAALHVLDHPAAPERVVHDGVEGEDGHLAAQQSLERLRDHLPPVVREDVEKDLPQDFARGEAVALLHGAVPRDHTPLEVERYQSLAEALDDAPDELLAYLRLPGERRHRAALGVFHLREDPEADGGAHEHHEPDGDIGPFPRAGRRPPNREVGGPRCQRHRHSARHAVVVGLQSRDQQQGEKKRALGTAREVDEEQSKDDIGAENPDVQP